MPAPNKISSLAVCAHGGWPRRAVGGLFAAAGFLLALAGGAAGQGSVALSPLEQARRTDEMLKRLSAAGPFVPQAASGATTATRAASSSTSSTSATLRPKTFTARRPAVIGRLTTATVIVRRNRILPSSAGFPVAENTSASRHAVTSSPLYAATGAPHPALPAIPVRQAAALATSATQGSIPAVNLAWLRVGNKTLPVVSKGTAATSATAATVRVNFADVAELRAKLGVDATRARNIIEFRTLYGPFKTPEDLAQVNGITEEMTRKWDEQNLLAF